MLTRLITHNDQIPFTSTSLTRFHSRSPPGISIKEYLDRIERYTCPNRICFLLILNYIDRICKNLINFTICSLTVHRFCITSVMIGSKFMCDSFYSNSRYAKVGGISLAELNLLEREFLAAIDYRLVTSIEELNKYYVSLVESHPLYKIEQPDKNQTMRIQNQPDHYKSREEDQKKELEDSTVGETHNGTCGIESDNSHHHHIVNLTKENPENNHQRKSIEQPIIISSQPPTEENIHHSSPLQSQLTRTRDQIHLDPVHQTSTVLPDCIQED